MQADLETLCTVAKFLRRNGFAYKRRKTQLRIYTTTDLFEKIKEDMETIIKVSGNKKMASLFEREQMVLITKDGKVKVIDNAKRREELSKIFVDESHYGDKNYG